MALDDIDVHNYFAKLLYDFGQQQNKHVVIRGLPIPDLENADDWLQYNLLKGGHIPDPQAYVVWEVEVAITSKKAHVREDQVFDAPYRLWKILKPLLHRSVHKIGTTCLRGKESQATHLDNRTVGQNFTPASVTSPDSGTHSLLIYTPFIEISKED